MFLLYHFYWGGLYSFCYVTFILMSFLCLWPFCKEYHQLI